MALTKSFKDTVRKRAVKDLEFREGLVKEAILELRTGLKRDGNIESAINVAITLLHDVQAAYVEIKKEEKPKSGKK